MPDPGDPVRVLELRSVRGTGGGPEKTILLGAAATDPLRARVTVCYVRDARDDVFHIGERARRAGAEYVEILERHSFDRQILGSLRALVRARDIEIIHSHDYKTDLLALLVARRMPLVPLATAHGWTGHSLRERLVYYPAHKQILRRFPLVLAVSSEIRQVLLKAGCNRERVRVLLNGIDHARVRRDPARVVAARAEFGLNAGVTALGAVGRLEPQKRFDILIDAFAAARGARPDLRLLIAGDGSSRKALAAQVVRLGLSDLCHLTGHLHDVSAFHHALDLFVQSSDYEGTPNAVLEAMAFETPIVATDVGGTAEICRPGVDGLVVPAGDPRHLRAALDEALENHEATAARVRSARARVEGELSFATRVRALESIYEELTGRVTPRNAQCTMHTAQGL